MKRLIKYKKIKRIKFTEKLMYDFKITDFTDSLVIFDDVDANTDKIV